MYVRVSVAQNHHGRSDREFNLHPTCARMSDTDRTEKQAMRYDDGWLGWDGCGAVWSGLTRLVDWGENATAPRSNEVRLVPKLIKWR